MRIEGCAFTMYNCKTSPSEGKTKEGFLHEEDWRRKNRVVCKRITAILPTMILFCTRQKTTKIFYDQDIFPRILSKKRKEG